MLRVERINFGIDVLIGSIIVTPKKILFHEHDMFIFYGKEY
jgi:hypothetical protein